MAANKIFMHVDGDAFFASCEQSTNMQWRGKPIAVGRERGIVTAISYEAKALGVKRPMSETELRRQFPQVALLASDYRKYELFSERMKSIVRRYVSDISEGSIDETFADVSAVTTWHEVRAFAEALQEELCTKLGLTVSIGVGPTMTIAKISSGFKKPRGLTIVTPEHLEVLHDVPLRNVPGIGGRTEEKLAGEGIVTIGNLLVLEQAEIARRFNKPLVELAYELRGTAVRALETREGTQSVSSIQAFLEPIIEFTPLLRSFAQCRAGLPETSRTTCSYKRRDDWLQSISRCAYAYYAHGKVSCAIKRCWHDYVPCRNRVASNIPSQHKIPRGVCRHPWRARARNARKTFHNQRTRSPKKARLPQYGRRFAHVCTRRTPARTCLKPPRAAA